jgi:ABC-type phosphonate transport system ATPase subunit
MTIGSSLGEEHYRGPLCLPLLHCVYSLSGSGKTTLLQSISLRSRAWNGALKYKGRVPGGDFFTASGK